MTSGDSKPYIFISYSHLDKLEVADDIEQLSKLGFRIWHDTRILVGRAWRESIEEHIKNCQLFIIFVSNNALRSDHVLAELDVLKVVKKAKGTTLFSIFLADDISDTNFDYAFLRRHQGIDRFKYGKVSEDYYVDLVRKLVEIAPGTREDDLERDTMILGLGYLPTFKDVLCDGRSLTPEEQEDRRSRIVLKLRNASTPITSYRIANMFQITSETTRALHHLGELKPFKTDLETPSNLLTRPLHIDEVYVTPMRLMVGLITRLDQNWPPIVASYSRLVKEDQTNHLEDLHYYIEFCWCAWGPSISTTRLLAEHRDFMIAQAAFGDEANSLPLIMKQSLWHQIADKLGRQDSGWPVTVKGALIVKPGIDDFFKAVRSYPLFADVFSDQSQVALYLPYHDKGHADGEILALTEKQEAYYSTAYVWAMLEQIEQIDLAVEGPRSGPMKPGRIIPFFEHANLATSKGLQFLEHCLARKVIYHILDCERDPDYRKGGYYRFATALFPERMVNILEQEIAKLAAPSQEIVRGRLQISRNPADWRTPVEVVEFTDAVEKIIKESCQALIEKTSRAESWQEFGVGTEVQSMIA